jgi:F-type H+-transporting ATPase subunit a
LRLSPDDLVFWRHGFVELNSTIATTWALMLAMTIGAWLITRKLATEGRISRWQGFLEIVVTTIQKQIEEVGLHHPEKYLGFLGTLFLFIAMSNLGSIIPGYEAPTGSLSTTAALAISVFVAVPLFGIEEQGFAGYLKSYLSPTWIMQQPDAATTITRTLFVGLAMIESIAIYCLVISMILIFANPFWNHVIETATGK